MRVAMHVGQTYRMLLLMSLVACQEIFKSNPHGWISLRIYIVKARMIIRKTQRAAAFVLGNY